MEIFYCFINLLFKFSGFLGDALANIIGGIATVFIIFFYKEFIQQKTNLTGEWEVTNTIKNSDYNPYTNLRVIWKMHLLQKGNIITGSGEKIRDIFSNNEEHEYTSEKRDLVELEGYIEKNYLRKSRIFIHVKQDGIRRKTRATYFLEYESDIKLMGTFITTAASSKGISLFIKNVKNN